MIYTERKVSIKNDKATIDSPIILFRGDREVEIMFTIVDSKFKFESNKGNVIDKTQAAFGQLAVALPDGTDLFTEIVETQNGVVIFSITGEMIDEIHEVGFYSFHIRLYNDDKTSRITLPPVMEGIEIREPLIIEGDVINTDLVGDATVGYSTIQTYGADEEIFDEDGNYIPTVWGIGDKITASKLNKIETTLETVNNVVAKIDTSADIVDSVEEMTNANKQYVHSMTNTWWAYKANILPAGSILPDVDNAINWTSTRVVINKRLNSSSAEVDAPGCAIFYFTFDDEMQNILNTVDPVWIRMKGCSAYATAGNATSTKLTPFSASGSSQGGYTPYSQVLAYVETKDGISDTPISSGIFNYNDNKTAPVTAIKFGYVNGTVSDASTNHKSTEFTNNINGKLALSLIVNFASKETITEEDLKDVYITFNEPIVTYEDLATEGYWYDTGIVYNVGDDNTTAVLGVKITEVEDKTNELQDVVDGLEDRVDKLENSSTGGGNTNTETTTTLPDYWKTRLDEIGDKIEQLQMENGMDTLQFLWCSDIHGVPGTKPSNTTYIGEIGRYLMDKHNIPFFMISGDIMSQASHGNTDAIWAEYDKLAPVLSPISNEELLAVRGNHDGVWGSPTEYNGQANQYYHSYIGDKALFNAFMRRQTLDSHRRVFDTSGMYFYVDYHNYRIYMMNSHTFGDDSVNEQGQAIYNGFKQCVFGTKQLQWIADTLMTVKEGQQVIFVSHAPINNMKDMYVFAQMLIAYRKRTNYTKTEDVSGTYWASGTEYSTSTVTKDFANAKGDFVGHFSGHIHTDKIEMFGYVPTFSITCAGGDVRDTYYTDGTLTRTRGTDTETAIDLVTVTSDYVYFTRIGSGYNRKFNRATSEITIDKDSVITPPEGGGELEPSNLFDINGDGYVAYDSSKMYTNWMPYRTAASGSKLSTVYHIKGSTPYKFHFKYPNGTETELEYCTNANSLALVPSDYDDKVLLFQHDFTDGDGKGYMIRFEFRTDCAERLIIQADKHISSNLAVPDATNTTDTSIWANGYRFSSSGIVEEAGTSISNKIDVVPGDIVCIEGVILRENADRVAIGFINATGEEKRQVGYFNNGTTGFNYLGCIDGVYRFEITEYPGGTVLYFRFAMQTPTNFNSVIVTKE